jgi:hypothetical protein
MDKNHLKISSRFQMLIVIAWIYHLFFKGCCHADKTIFGNSQLNSKHLIVSYINTVSILVRRFSSNKAAKTFSKLDYIFISLHS